MNSQRKDFSCRFYHKFLTTQRSIGPDANDTQVEGVALMPFVTSHRGDRLNLAKNSEMQGGKKVTVISREMNLEGFDEDY